MTTYLDLVFAIEVALDEPTVRRFNELGEVCSALIISFRELESIGIGNFTTLSKKIMNFVYNSNRSDLNALKGFFDEYTALINKLTDTAGTCFGISGAVLMYSDWDGGLMWSRVDYSVGKHQFIEIVFHPNLKVCELVRINGGLLRDDDVDDLMGLLDYHPDLLERYPELFI